MKIYNYFNKIWKIVLNVLIPINKKQETIKNISANKFLSLTYLELVPVPPIKNSIVLFNYKNKLVKEAIWSLKFKNNIKISKLFGQILYDYLIEELADLKLSHNFDNPLLIPIPISKKKKFERGYNQTELIASEINKLDKNNSFEFRKNILKKIKNTIPQSRTKNKAEREKNLESCFKVIMPKLVKNRNIILLDDVVTTGATFTEAKETLQEYSPKNIICVALAH